MNDFKNNILKGIKTGEIKAESRWRFLAHDYLFWFLTAGSTLLGAFTIASILHRIAIDQAPLAPHMKELATLPVFVQTLPYLWILVLLVLGLAAWFNFKKTSKAYKHQVVALLGMLIASMMLGGVLFAVGAGGAFDQEIRKRVPVFEKERVWRQELRQNFLEKRGGIKSSRDQEFQNNNQRINLGIPPRRAR